MQNFRLGTLRLHLLALYPFNATQKFYLILYVLPYLVPFLRCCAASYTTTAPSVKTAEVSFARHPNRHRRIVPINERLADAADAGTTLATNKVVLRIHTIGQQLPEVARSGPKYPTSIAIGQWHPTLGSCSEGPFWSTSDRIR